MEKKEYYIDIHSVTIEATSEEDAQKQYKEMLKNKNEALYLLTQYTINQ